MVDSGIEHSWNHLEYFVGDLPDSLGDAPAVHGFERNCLENQKV
jgi:hypothetical protein